MIDNLVAKTEELTSLNKKLSELYLKRTLWYIWKNDPNAPRLEPYKDIYKFV